MGETSSEAGPRGPQGGGRGEAGGHQGVRERVEQLLMDGPEHGGERPGGCWGNGRILQVRGGDASGKFPLLPVLTQPGSPSRCSSGDRLHTSSLWRIAVQFRIEPPPCPDSPLARLDPRWKLAAVVLVMVGVVLLKTLIGVGL